MSPRLAASFLLVLLLAACSAKGGKESTPKSKTPDERIIVRVEKPSIGSMAARLEITARVSALENAEVLPRVEGLVREVLVDEGDDVKKGDILARLEDDQLQNALEKAQVALERAKLQESVANLSREEAEARLNGMQITLDKRKSERERALNQYEKKALSEQDRDKAEYDFTTARSEHEQAAIKLRQTQEEIAQAALTVKDAEIAEQKAELDLSWTTLVAPISGRVMRRNLRLGQKTIVGQSAFAIADLTSLVIEPKLPEKDLRLLREGLPVFVESTSYPGETRKGSISLIAPEVEMDGGSIRVRIKLEPGNPPLRPGMFVSGHVETERRQEALLINKKALLFDRERAYVFLAEEQDGEMRARKVYVRRGLQDADRVEYLPVEGREAEIVADSQVIVIGLDKLADGASISLSPAAKEVPDAKAEDKNNGKTDPDKSEEPAPEDA